MAHELKALGPVYLQALCRRLLVGAVLWAVVLRECGEISALTRDRLLVLDLRPFGLWNLDDAGEVARHR